MIVRPSADQCPQTIFRSRSTRPGTSNHGPWRIVLRHILPNAMRPLLVTVTLGVGQIIVWASALSFLGLGKPPPAAEWGTLLSVGRDFVALAWWMSFFPGVFIVLTTLSTSVLGRWLQRRLEGRSP